MQTDTVHDTNTVIKNATGLVKWQDLRQLTRGQIAYNVIIVIYLGINSRIEVGLLLAFMLTVGLFGGVSSAITSYVTLPKVCKSRFDMTIKKDDDGYKGVIVTE